MEIHYSKSARLHCVKGHDFLYTLGQSRSFLMMSDLESVGLFFLSPFVSAVSLQTRLWISEEVIIKYEEVKYLFCSSLSHNGSSVLFMLKSSKTNDNTNAFFPALSFNYVPP